MYVSHFQCASVYVCVQEFKLFHYSAQLMLLKCVSSFNLIIHSHSPSLSPIIFSLSFPLNPFHSLFYVFLSALLPFKFCS